MVTAFVSKRATDKFEKTQIFMKILNRAILLAVLYSTLDRECYVRSMLL